MQRFQLLFSVTALAVLLLIIAAMRANDWHLGGSQAISVAKSGNLQQATTPASPVQGAAIPEALPASRLPMPGAPTKRGVFTMTYESDSIDKLRRTNLSNLSAMELENLYFHLAEQQHVTCPRSVRVGDTLDGGWDVCISEPFGTAQSSPCVAFSFGINNVWSYDDELADLYGCRVHMFDPSMQVPDHQRRRTSWFYRTGLAGGNRMSQSGWRMQTLCSLFEDLGYGNATVDLLKLDIEHWEWDSLDRAISDGCLRRVKQLLFESHTGEVQGEESDYAIFIRVWRRLFELGFRAWNWHRNPQSVYFEGRGGAERACCYEHYLINTKFLHW